ncbi:MAG: hypothetical protein QXP39_01615 [Candidatus Aenigmatarchaeota archaeon]
MKKFLITVLIAALAAGFAYISLSGFLVYQTVPEKPKNISIDVNMLVPITSYLKIDDMRWPLNATITDDGTAYNVTQIEINPSEYQIGYGNHTISIVDLRSGNIYFSAQLELTSDWAVIRPM